jgi:uncharacterized phosphosugar-binding protein
MSEKTSHPFFDSIRCILDEVEATQLPAIRSAAHVIAEKMASGGVLHAFGTGHSHIMAEEIFFRAGGLVQINPILDPGLMLNLSATASTALERLEGYMPIVLQRYDLRTSDVMLIISTSGRNAASIDTALYARQRGLTVIALTSVAAYRDISVRHSTGKHLYELADIVIDSCVPQGDAVLSLPGTKMRMGPISTIIGVTIVQTLIYEATQQMIALGYTPEIIVSANGEEVQDHRAMFEKYGDRLRHR